MKQSLKIALASIFVCFASFSNALSQNVSKVEYGLITYRNISVAGAYTITISLNSEIKVEKGKRSSGVPFDSDVTPVNKVLKDLSEEGWEVYNTGLGPAIFYFYIKRKL